MIEQCRNQGMPQPEFHEIGGATVVRFWVNVGSTDQVTAHVAAILKAAQEPRSREELQKVAGLKHRMHFQKSYLEPLMNAGWLQMTIPGKPKSRLQRYRTTPTGAAAFAEK